MKGWWIELLRHARPPARLMAGILLLLVAGGALDALKPWPVKLLVDCVLKPQGGGQTSSAGRWLERLPGVAGSTSAVVAWLAAAGVLLFCAAQAVRVMQSYLQSGLGGRIAYRLGAELLERLQELSLIFHSQQRTGDLVRRVVTDSGCVRDLVCGVVIPGAAALANLAIMFGIMLRLDGVLAVIAISFAAPLALLIRFFSAPLARRSYEQQDLDGQMMSLAEQTLGAIPVVQSFAREDVQERQFGELAGRTRRASLRAVSSQLQFKIGTGAVTAIGTATVMVVGGMHVLDGRLTIGGLLVFIAYLAALYAPLETLAYLSTGYATAAAGARRVLEVLASEQRIRERPDARAMAVPAQARGLAIRFERVRFGYRAGEAVLEGIDLEIEAGRTVALVGPTGAGKSTLAGLVPRLFDPWEGRVMIAGQDLRDLTLGSVRKQIAVVPQDVLLLPLSVAENIAYGRADAAMEQIERAAEAAGAAEFIQRLPEGYRTVLGERGCTLSAGQRQRIAIARAMLRDSPVLILDEPTSALDAATEAGIVEALRRLMEGRTCLIIAHRLSTIRHADTIVVLERGRIVEQGPHARLLAEGGTYRRLCELQTGAELGARDAQPATLDLVPRP